MSVLPVWTRRVVTTTDEPPPHPSGRSHWNYLLRILKALWESTEWNGGGFVPRTPQKKDQQKVCGYFQRFCQYKQEYTQIVHPKYLFTLHLETASARKAKNLCFESNFLKTVFLFPGCKSDILSLEVFHPKLYQASQEFVKSSVNRWWV